MKNIGELTGIEKIAYIVRIIGWDKVKVAFKSFDRETIEAIEKHIPAHAIMKDLANELMADFTHLVANTVSSSDDFSLLDAWDEEKNGSPNVVSRKLDGFVKLSQKSEKEIFEFLSSESMINKVVILKSLPIELSQRVFALFDTDSKASYAIEAASATELTDEHLISINSAIEKRLANSTGKTVTSIDKLLSLTDIVDEDELNIMLEKLPVDLAKVIRDNTLTISIIAAQDIKVLSAIFDEISSDDTAQAICGMPIEFQNKVLETLTPTRKADIKYAIESVANPNDKKATSMAHRAVISVAKELLKKEEIFIVR
ncbi:FliG C-terminal domain-containing protein [Photobacterium kishitanii]|uniref:Flagellar motor switch protein FliG C-terminal domain-containing protein n=1 Tax=Photobacterium kishitanii TaxID=318456 RepID=A0A2T3KMU3_9GAMM|nr:FliG C-terminal domain-containing protein [Photobacterium kishitanii]PSV01111.1 hypothetical protein C9J27_03570 [Photobacterium kishitanii]